MSTFGSTKIAVVLVLSAKNISKKQKNFWSPHARQPRLSSNVRRTSQHDRCLLRNQTQTEDQEEAEEKVMLLFLTILGLAACFGFLTYLAFGANIKEPN